MIERSAAGRELVDTNIFICAVDVSAREKQQRAQDFVSNLTRADRIAVSVQTLNEFYSATTRARAKLLPEYVAAEAVREMTTTALVLSLQAEDTLSAIAAVDRHGMSFWDALLWAVAKRNGISVIHTEDFQHGRTVEGVTFLNPFVAQ